MIILIRHAQSEGNKNREIHQTVPDHRVKLTPEGHRQALEAGRRLRALLRPDDTLHFFTSPYRRTRETTEGILTSLTSDHPSPSPFPRHTIKVYEEPRLREQDFGNFQPCSAEMERMWQERADYGHFFYRIPNGESAADAYDRISGFNETLWRLFGEDDFASVCILVTHGLMTRVFLMKWYHWSVEYFEDLRNVNHCEFVIMEKNPDNGKYVLQNKLRTWSELRKEKELEWMRERAARGLAPVPVTPSDSPIPVRRKWGGCPDGCNHGLYKSGRRRSVKNNAADPLRNDGNDNDNDDAHNESNKNHQSSGSTETKTTKGNSSSSTTSTTTTTAGSSSQSTNNNHSNKANHLTITTYKPESIDDIVSSPDGTPSYISLAAISHPKAPSTPSVLSSEEDRPRPPTNPKSSESSRPHTAGRDNNSSNNNKKSSNNSSSLSPLRPDTPDNRSPASRGIALLHLGGRDGGGSQSGANSIVASDDENEDSDHPIDASRNPAQEIDDGDGDDEWSGKRRSSSRRVGRQPHHHSHLHHSSTMRQQYQGMANVLGDGDDREHMPDNDHARQGQSDDDEHEHEHDHDHEHEHEHYDEALEMQRKRDQSIRGSVY